MCKTAHYALLLSLFLGMVPSFAADAELIKMLEEKGYLTQSEAQEIINKDEVRVEPGGKHTEMLKISALFQMQYNYIETDDAGGTQPDTRNNFQLRRAYLGIEARLSDGFGAIIMPNFGGGKARLDHAYIYKTLENPDIDLYLGFRKVRFNLEQYSSTGRLRTIERSIVSSYWGNDTGTENQLTTGSAANGDLGFGAQHIGLFGNYQVNDNLGMELAVVNGYAGDLSNNDFQSSPGFYYQLNTTWDLAEEENEILQLSAGVNTGYQPYGNSFWQPTDTGSTGAGSIAIGNSSGNAAVFGINPYVMLEWDNFIFTTEFLANWIANGKLYTQNQLLGGGSPSSGQAVPMGFIITPSYRFAEDFEVVFRYTYLDTDGRGAQTNGTFPNAPSIGRQFFNKAQSYYLGFNWYILDNDLKLQFGYQYVEYSDRYINPGSAGAGNFSGPGANINAFRTQIQLIF